MVVGADHRGRAGVGIWRDAATGPLTALASGPATVGTPAGPGQRPDGVAGGSRPSGRSRPQPCRPAGPGWASDAVPRQLPVRTVVPPGGRSRPRPRRRVPSVNRHPATTRGRTRPWARRGC
jgi:hypothetical protein